MGPLADVKYRVEYLALTTDDGEELWLTFLRGLSNHAAQTHRRWLTGGTDPMTVRIVVDA